MIEPRDEEGGHVRKIDVRILIEIENPKTK